MSFSKNYPNRKDWRRPYYTGPKQFDGTCRNHGSCPYCASGRKHRERRQEPVVDEVEYRTEEA